MRRLNFSIALALAVLAVAPAGGTGDDGAESLELPYRRHVVTVDGSLHDWREPYLEVSLTDPELTSPLGNHVIARLAWDFEALYVNFDVTDDEVFSPPFTAQGAELFCGDSVELYVDVDGDAGEFMSARDFQFVVACDGRAAVLHGDRLLVDAGFRVPKRVHESAVFRHVVARSTTGYAVELGIPWATLGIDRPQRGRRLGIDVAVNDWVRPFPPAASGVEDDLKVGALRRLTGQADDPESPITARLEEAAHEPTPEDGYWCWSWSGARDLGYPSQWSAVRLSGRPSLMESLDRRIGALRLPAATLAGAGFFTLVAALVIRTRDRRRGRALLRRIEELEEGRAGAGEEPADGEGAIADELAPPQPDAAAELPRDSGHVPVTSELSGKIDRVRRMVRREEPVPNDLTTRAIARIYEDLERGLTPSDLADSLFVSLRTLQRAISTSLGCSPSELIMAVRLREAYRMLKVEQRPVKDAALSAGFTSQPHFSRKFKHYFGINPSEVLAGREPDHARPARAD